MSQPTKFGQSVVWEMMGCTALPSEIKQWFWEMRAPLQQVSNTKDGVAVMFLAETIPATSKVDKDRLGVVAESAVRHFKLTGIRPAPGTKPKAKPR